MGTYLYDLNDKNLLPIKQGGIIALIDGDGAGEKKC